jgi:hypothetical protein
MAGRYVVHEVALRLAVMIATRITSRESRRAGARRVEVKSSCNPRLIQLFNGVDVSRLRNMFNALVVDVLPFTNLHEM